MAFEDELRDFMELRLTAFDPAIDLSPNAAAQVQIIEPLVARFGDDPFAVDIPTFLRERLVQEYPELAADSAGMLEDLFTKPLQTVLEPFKRAIERANLNQSVENASLMSTDEANALGANFFQDREEGDFAGGLVRVYFSAPTTVRITTDKQFTSRSGLFYFPTSSVFIQSSQMLFNRDGSLFFVDVTVRAEETGDGYNIPANDIISLEDVESVVKVANLTAFSTGQPAQTNEEYLGGIPEALTERSLATTRGVATRVPDVFGTQVRALQVVGGGEEGMNRDVLQGTGEGFLHMVGRCSFFDSWVVVGEVVYRDDGPNDNITIQTGDNIRLILSVTDDVNKTVYPAVINDIISVGVGTAAEKHILILDRTLDTLIGSTSTGASGVPVVSVFKPGFITISGRPGGIVDFQTVEDDVVHLGGHSDVFVRPSADVKKESVLPNLTDGSPLLALLDLTTTADNNLISTATDLVAAGVTEEDALVIETGNAAGTYKILSVGSPDAATEMRVDSIIEAAEAPLRGRVFRNITIDLVEPKVPKIPFTSSPVNDLRMSVGSKLFRLNSTDIQSFGAVVGDTIRVLEGPNTGDYVIESFDLVLGGQGPIVDRAAAATIANVRYEVFTKADGLEFPLVRIEGLEILDSTNQGTGITVPYGDAVDVRPLCDFEGAGTSIRVLTKDLVVFPEASSIWGTDGSSLTPVIADALQADEDASYSQELKLADGIIRTIAGGVGSDIVTTEFNVPPFMWNGRNDTILALDTREDSNWTTPLSPGDQHRTSDLAEASVGDSIVLLDGPNAGNYTIQDHRVIDFYTSVGHRKVAIIQLDRELSVDPLKSVIDFIADAGVAAAITPNDLVSGLESIATFFSSTFWVTHIVAKLTDTINDVSQMGPGTITTDEVDELLLGLVGSGYEVGPSATGTLRVFFQEPVSAEFSFGENPTFFQVVNQPEQQYRISPGLPKAQILPQAQEQQDPSEWNRNLILHTASREKAYLRTGSAFAKRGIRNGDILEYYRAHNDLPARINMKSSWLFVTKAGSNVVRGIFPTTTAEYPTPNNNIPVEEGHLFFVDSGPDVGSYVVTEVLSTDFTNTPSNVEFKVDRIMTHSTELFPGPFDIGFDSDAQGAVSSADNTFPMDFGAGGQTLKIEYDTESVSYVGATYTFTFSATIYNTIGDLVTALNADTGFVGTGGNERFLFYADGDKLVVRSELNNTPGGWVRIDAGSTALGGALLQFTAGDEDGRRLYAVARAGTKRIYGTSLTASAPYLWQASHWVSLYAARRGLVENTEDDLMILAGGDEAYLGTFEVVSVDTETSGPMIGLTYVELDRSAVFPDDAQVHWVRHLEPITDPSNTTDGGKELAQSYVRGRLYRESPEQVVVSIPWLTATQNPLLDINDLALPDEPEQVHLSIDPLSGPLPNLSQNWSHKMPYRVLRDEVLKISSTEMEANRDGALYYIDIPVQGRGVHEELNIGTDTGLQLEGNYKIDGYTLQVRDEIFVFSEDEEVSIVLPPSVLPVGSTPDLDNRANLAGQNLQVNYDNAELISNIQQFFDSPLDRVVLANVLVRHFLPSYVILDATYSGGKSEALIAAKLIDYINNIDPNINELSADEIGKIIHQQGAVQVQRPIRMIVLTHGVDRRIRGTQSVNIIGGTNLPTFSGTFKQTYFIAGPNTSDEGVRPVGEQVFLDRL